MNICLAVYTHKEQALSCALNIIKLFSENGVQTLMVKEQAMAIGRPEVTVFESFDEIFNICDFAVTVGGDGIIIHTAKYAAEKGVPLIGVNVGRVGFAAELEPYEYKQLRKIITGEYTIRERMLLSVTVSSSDEERNFCCVNEAVVSRGSLSKIIDLSVSLNGEQVSQYRADGLLFATPTGSTAYSLSAGGPVVDPDMECILMTPICPYSLSARCVVLESRAILSVTAHNIDRTECFLTVDGRDSVRIYEGDRITVHKAPYTLKMINVKNRNFFKVINDKFETGE